ncbi:RsmE family RNA methyltransferase [Ekhidna sp.]|uniref:RsmE family RNA methyltransferase n=1 Tax=Ekhidna sp. TaxID=2608089 RepID=UPI003B50393C
MTIFYQNSIQGDKGTLSEEESKHCTQVLRHQTGDKILVYDGLGGKYKAILTEVSRKSCAFEVLESSVSQKKNFSIHLVIAPTKNMDRMEWLIEKLSEIGVDVVTFIQTKQSERRKIRMDRLEKKAISAMKQSGNPFLLQLNSLVSLDSIFDLIDTEVKLIAHVDQSHKHLGEFVKANKSTTILIGPEGDFSLDEVERAKNAGFQTVSLGENTLRTETAGLMACCAVNFINKY